MKFSEKIGSWCLAPRVPDAGNSLFEDLQIDTAALELWDLEDHDLPFESVDLYTWMCTDTVVGLRLIFYCNIPVAFLWQPARKSVPDVLWIKGAPIFNIIDYAMARIRQVTIQRWKEVGKDKEMPGAIDLATEEIPTELFSYTADITDRITK